MKRSLPALLPALLALVMTLAAPHAAAIGTPAGTPIQNQASVTADPLMAGDPAISVLSNAVLATVSPVCSVSVLPDGSVAAPGQSAAVLPGESAPFRYTLTNTGNERFTFDVTGLVDAASAYTPALAIYADAAAQGQPLTSVTLGADETATVFLVATPSAASRGDAFVNLSAGCAGAHATDPGALDSNNVSRVTAGEPPVLSVEKTFAPALVKPGDVSTVTVTARNSGQGSSRPVTLVDALNLLASQGLSYVPGSAAVSVSAGSAPAPQFPNLEFTADGTTYTAAEPAGVVGVRAVLPALAPAQTLTLTFKMLAGAAAENKTLTNVASASSSGLTLQASADLSVRYQPAVALGPLGNAAAPEGSPADAQSVPFAVVGQPVCLDHTLTNTGDVADSFRVNTAVTGGQAVTTLQAADGTGLAQPLTLQPGQSVTVRLCTTATAAGTVSVKITASGDRGETNATTDTLGEVQSGLPTLVKSVDKSGTVVVGDALTYTLKVTNPYTRPLNAAQASDVLNAGLTFTAASAGGTYDPATRTVSWALGTLAAGETRTLTVTARVAPDAADGQTISNRFALMSTELPQPTLSNTVQNPVWSARLVISKAVDNLTPSYGDALTYTLVIKNLSQTTAVTAASITDTLPAGLVYLPGSSTLGGAATPDPAVSGQVLTWSGLTLPAGVSVTVTYRVRVTPSATGDLVNTVVVRGVGGTNNATAVASNTANAKIRVTPLGFAPLGELIGSVYVDRNRDGRYEQDTDLPLPRARVILAGGRLALTDDEGRYHFSNVLFGTQALRLDPASVPYLPLHLPSEGGLAGTQTVQVQGLTSVDFPLAPLYGDIQTLRRTELQMGELTVQKTVYVNGNAYGVRLRLSTPRPLPGFVLDDPLPAGATLQGAPPAAPATLPAGETVLDYQFTYRGDRAGAVTDPSASWRY